MTLPKRPLLEPQSKWSYNFSSPQLDPIKVNQLNLLEKAQSSEEGTQLNIEKDYLLNTQKFIEFWTLGGASILLFFILMIASIFRENSVLLQQKFLMFGAFFSLMSLVCNHPHFMIGFKFAYYRGWRFVLKHWFSLLFMPMALLSIIFLSYTQFDKSMLDLDWVKSINELLLSLHLKFRLGENQPLGPELVSLLIWFMYATVGWHYSKQIYGCMMVYDQRDQYNLGSNQKLIIRYNLIFLALYQFLKISERMDASSDSHFSDSRFSSINIASIGFPHFLLILSEVLLLTSFIGVLLVIIERYYKEKKWPSIQFLVPWIAIYCWWIECVNLPEFYYLAVPFFHSLQYLPFASKMEFNKVPKNKYYFFKITLRISILLLIGFFAFEMIPASLDQALNTENTKIAWFFVTTFALFINIQHFFIDSTVWKFDQKEFQTNILKNMKI